MNGWKYNERDRWVLGSAPPTPGLDGLASRVWERVRTERHREFCLLRPCGLVRYALMPEVLLRDRLQPRLSPAESVHVPGRSDGSTCRRPSPGRRSGGIGLSEARW